MKDLNTREGRLFLKSQGGFSLMELMVVVVIIVIVTSLAYPSFESSMAERRLHHSTRAVINEFQYARMQAIGRGIAHRVELDLPQDGNLGGQLRVFLGDLDSCITFDPEPLRILDLTGFGGVGLTEVHPQGLLESALCFRSNGRVFDATTGLPPNMGDTSGLFGVRASSVALVLRRFSEGADGSAVGVRREIILPHLGVAQINELGL